MAGVALATGALSGALKGVRFGGEYLKSDAVRRVLGTIGADGTPPAPLGPRLAQAGGGMGGDVACHNS